MNDSTKRVGLEVVQQLKGILEENNQTLHAGIAETLSALQESNHRALRFKIQEAFSALKSERVKKAEEKINGLMQTTLSALQCTKVENTTLPSQLPLSSPSRQGNAQEGGSASIRNGRKRLREGEWHHTDSV